MRESGKKELEKKSNGVHKLSALRLHSNKKHARKKEMKVDIYFSFNFLSLRIQKKEE